MTNKYLDVIAQASLEKKAIDIASWMQHIRDLAPAAEHMAAAGAAWHGAQNLMTDTAMRLKKSTGRVADAFQQGVAGHHEGSLWDKIKGAATSILSPEMEAMRHQAHEAGLRLSHVLPNIPKRAQVGLRQLSEGRFNDYARLKGRQRLDTSQQMATRAAMDEIKRHTGVDPMALAEAPEHIRQKAQQVWQSKRYPLLRQVAKLSRGSSEVKKQVQGHLNKYLPTLAQAPLAVMEPLGAGLNAVKTSTLIPGATDLKVGKYKPVQAVEDYFTRHQAELGAAHPEEGGLLKRIGGQAYRFGLNPVSHQIKSTSAALKRLELEAAEAKAKGG